MIIELMSGHVFEAQSIRAIDPIKFYGYDHRAAGGPHSEGNYGCGFAVYGVGFVVDVIPIPQRKASNDGLDDEMVLKYVTLIRDELKAKWEANK